MNEHIKKAERLLSMGNKHPSEWAVNRAKTEALVSIAKSLETLATLAEEIATVYRHPITLVTSGEPITVNRLGTQCPDYPEMGGCFHPDGKGHEGACMSAQVARG